MVVVKIIFSDSRFEIKNCLNCKKDVKQFDHLSLFSEDVKCKQNKRLLFCIPLGAFHDLNISTKNTASLFTNFLPKSRGSNIGKVQDS